jgi:hypothetical protein
MHLLLRTGLIPVSVLMSRLLIGMTTIEIGRKLNISQSAVSLEHGFAWAGQKLEAGMIKVMDDTRHIAGKLIEGSGCKRKRCQVLTACCSNWF